jgi:hypothetical protein
MRFRSKVDGWFIPIMVISFAGLIVGLGGVMLSPMPWILRVIVTAAIVAIMYLVATIFRNTYYEIVGTDLLVRSGPLKWTIPVAEIQEITPSRNILSAPALSLDRLRIRFGKRAYILVSPEDKDGFLRAVKEAQGR